MQTCGAPSLDATKNQTSTSFPTSRCAKIALGADLRSHDPPLRQADIKPAMNMLQGQLSWENIVSGDTEANDGGPAVNKRSTVIPSTHRSNEQAGEEKRNPSIARQIVAQAVVSLLTHLILMTGRSGRGRG